MRSRLGSQRWQSGLAGKKSVPQNRLEQRQPTGSAGQRPWAVQEEGCLQKNRKMAQELVPLQLPAEQAGDRLWNCLLQSALRSPDVCGKLQSGDLT